MFLIQSATTQQHVHTQVHLKELEYLGKVTFFTYSRFIKHTIKYFKLNIFCFNFDDPVSQNIRTEHKTNKKKRIIIYYIYIIIYVLNTQSGLPLHELLHQCGKTCYQSGKGNHHLYTQIRDGDILFQQDLTPAHSATTTSYWFADHSITVLDWPANSSDLNPIDNLWGIVKMNMRDAKTVKDLEVLRMLGR